MRWGKKWKSLCISMHCVYVCVFLTCNSSCSPVLFIAPHTRKRVCRCVFMCVWWWRFDIIFILPPHTLSSIPSLSSSLLISGRLKVFDLIALKSQQHAPTNTYIDSESKGLSFPVQKNVMISSLSLLSFKNNETLFYSDTTSAPNMN